MPDSTIHISSLETTRSDGDWCAGALVDGHPLWFKSKDTQIKAAPEAFLSAMLIPALHTGSKLHIEAEIDPRWVENSQTLVSIYHKWWGYPAKHPLVNSSEESPAPLHHDEAEESKTALCFTGGADSFYSLLRGGFNPNFLLFVRGFDIPLDDEKRYTDFKKSLDQITKATGTSAIVVSTNLRQHPSFSKVSWERTHGAALASVGHLLTASINRMGIPSSNTTKHGHPWGSHWETDSFWGIPDKLEIIHGTNEVHRMDKIFKFAEEPLVQHHLRVCWQNTGETGNCSECEKCLRTMVTLEASGHLPKYYRVFNTETPVPVLLDNIKHIPYHFIFIWNDLLTLQLSESTRSAIQRLIQRSKQAHLKKRFKKGFWPVKFVTGKIGRIFKNLPFRATDEP